MMSKDPLPRAWHPLIYRFGHARLCRAQVKHIDQFQESYYHLVSFGLCRAQEPLGMPIDWIYRDTVPVEASATSLPSTGAALPNDVPGPPPRHTSLSFANLVMPGSAEPYEAQ